MPERRCAADIQLLFASDQSGNSRWHLNLWRTDADGWRLVLYAHDGTAAVQSDAVLATRADVAMDAWAGTWRHLALVHKADGGNGKGSWALYLDGNHVRTVEDVAAVSSTYKPIPGFTIGGRWNTANRAFVGCVDQVRVCRAALRPTQFLNAQADAETATDVLRYWPLNVQGGVCVDGRDATGQGVELSVPWNANQLPTSYASEPDVSNPDSSLAGCPSATGSTWFFDPNGSDKRDYSSLATFDAATLELYNSKRAMTLEYYYRSFRSAKCDNTRCLLCFIDVPYTGSWTWRGLFNYRDADNARFHFQDQVYCNVASDTKLGDVSMVYDGEWHHVAIVRSPTETGFTYSFYQDGTACGTASSTFARETPNKAMALVVGGRWWNNANSMDGALASLRVTEGALTADEFLNATPAAPLGPVSVWNAKTATLPMTNLNVGTWAAYDTAFTFEMELTLPAASATEVELFGAYATSPASGVTAWPGWRVFLRPDGNVRLEAACGANYGSYARGTFACDLTASLGKRERLAIVYNPQEGEGVWRLYRNARCVGTLSNLFSPVGTTSATTGTAYLPRPFVLGAGVGGSARNIRLSRAVLTAGELLCSRGMTILFR